MNDSLSKDQLDKLFASMAGNLEETLFRGRLIPDIRRLRLAYHAHEPHLKLQREEPKAQA